MFSIVHSFALFGIEGRIVAVEADLRWAVPGIDIVGLPDGAVKEARERARVAIRNSGFDFPMERILVNLAPADIRKEGASYDLPIAAAILAASEQISQESLKNLLILGELNLSGEVKPVKGVLSAIGTALEAGFTRFLVPSANMAEARILASQGVMGLNHLGQIKDVLEGNLVISGERRDEFVNLSPLFLAEEEVDMADIKGHHRLKRAMEVAAAGGHHLFLFGPPGSGKTMAARRLPGLLPDLAREEALMVTRIYSAAGLFHPQGLLRRPGFRAPHHTASSEGVIGGGKNPRPGEVSLAHGGVLFLDEAPEFKKSLLQTLREPIEQQRVTISRANGSVWFPASFQLVLAANPCPCGNLGRKESTCHCAAREIYRYWQRLGGALLDRIDIRVPLSPTSPEELIGEKGESTEIIRQRVNRVVDIQARRYEGLGFKRNARLPPGMVDRFCILDKESRSVFTEAIKKMGLSSRACHSVLKLARTIADLDNSQMILKYHLLEAVQHRRYGDGDYYWSFG
ncbi:MAG: YifB family Mg chelatase-like AAA ATPase [Spirochaetales bacterium]|nr:YifB family Mg chelatase-like AAA ATPase [Spirochaetales bacterium]